MPGIVQRWRLVYQRGPEAAELSQRAELEAWEVAVGASELPLAMSGAAHPRPRVSMPPPLPVGFTAAREPLDLQLVARRTAAEVRERVSSVIPADHAIVDLFDVWVGSPALPADVVALDYAVATDPPVPAERLAEGARRLLEATSLERVRRRGDRETRYDLRPFLLGLDALPRPGDRDGTLRMRLAVHPEQGAGRPDEAVAALGERLGLELALVPGVRTRVWTGDERPTERIG